MLVVKYYEYNGSGKYEIKCEKFLACYPVEDSSMIFEQDGTGAGTIINIRRIISIGIIER